MTLKYAVSPELHAQLCARLERVRAARRPPVHDDPPIVGDPIPADEPTVAAWAAEHGVRFREWEELPAINALRDAHHLPRFKRLFPTRGRFG